MILMTTERNFEKSMIMNSSKSKEMQMRKKLIDPHFTQNKIQTYDTLSDINSEPLSYFIAQILPPIHGFQPYLMLLKHGAVCSQLICSSGFLEQFFHSCMNTWLTRLISNVNPKRTLPNYKTVPLLFASPYVFKLSSCTY